MPNYKILNREKDILFGNTIEGQVETQSYIAGFSAIYDNKVYPDNLTYADMLGPAHNQIYEGRGLGTCYAEAATGWIEYWVWRKSGILFEFTRNEIFDVAIDAKQLYGYDYRAKNSLAVIFATGGSPNNVFHSAFKYNQKLGWHYFTNMEESEKFKLFNELASVSFIENQFKVRQLTDFPFYKDVETTHKNTVKVINEFGPFVYVSYTDSNKRSTHAWLAVGYTENGLLLRNSYGDPVPILDKWENVVKYATDGTWNCLPLLKI